MRHTRRSTTAAIASIALATTAFAPAVGHDAGPEGHGSSAVGSLGVTYYLDDDPDTVQPVVFEVLSSIDQSGQTLGSERWSRHGFGYAYVVLGDDHCGDLGGPQDRAAVNAVAEYLAGQRLNEEGTLLPGVDGRVIAIGADGPGGLLLAAATAYEGSLPYTAVATTGAVTDMHDARFSDGNVQRSEGLLAEDATCSYPPQASDPGRTTYWAERDASQRGGQLAVPTLTVHDGASPYELGHALDLWASMGARDAGDPNAPRRWLRLDTRDPGLRWGNPTVGTELLDRFVAGHLGDPEALAALAGEPRVQLRTGFAQCVDLGPCDGPGGFWQRSFRHDPLPHTTEVALHLNRTFEQDLDCTPVCVPGPGTGEVGTLEVDNRFESPWAPVFTWVDAGVNSEVLTADDPLNDGSGVGGVEEAPGGHGYHSLAFATPPVEVEVDVVGRVRLEGYWNTGRAGGTVTPILIDLAPNGDTRIIDRGAIALDYHRDPAVRAHESGWKRMDVAFSGVVHTLAPGHRLQVVLQSQNGGVFVPGSPQGTVNVATGPVPGLTDTGSVLYVPVLEGSDPSAIG